MSLSIVNKLILFCLIWGTLLYANNCPKWFPMPSNDGLVVVLPIYDASITASDLDCDGIVDSVDSDIDGDGVANSTDAFPLNSRESIDTDGDGIGNNADNDDDNDGTVDNEDSNPLVNEVPVAHAGDDRQEDINTTIVLDASSSTDDGTILTYSWVLTNKPEGSVATLSNTTSISPSFYGDKVGAYRLELTVSDGILTSIKDVVFVNVGRESTLIAFDDGIHGMEPWITNGTPEGTHLLKDINIKNGSSHIQNMVDAGDVIYFSVNDYELWKSDGSEEGTVRVKTFSSKNIGLFRFTMLNHILYFQYNDELWRSDGSTIGTIQIKDDLNPINFFSRSFPVLNNYLYFSAKGTVNGYELWKSDGTEDGTTMVKNIYKGDTNLSDFIIVNSLLYFRVHHTRNQDELWKSDGTQTGTEFIKQFNSNHYYNINIRNLVDVNGTLYFTADDGIHGRELWKSDGTQEGTVMVKDINIGSQGSNLYGLFTVSNILYFTITNSIGTQLWKSDGSEVNTVMVKNFLSDSIGQFVSLNNIVYFSKNDTELWKSDGTNSGTILVKDGLFDMYGMTYVNGILYFDAGMGENKKLWKSDGTTTGTVSLIDIKNTSNSTNIKHFLYSNTMVFFVGNNGIDGNELWKSDGTEVGTTMVKNISTNTYASLEYDYKNFIKIGHYYYFVADNGVDGNQLWKSDGTDVGTAMVKDLHIVEYGSDPSILSIMDHRLYFTAESQIGVGLWKSDGTLEGTEKIVDSVNPIKNLTVSGDLLYFTKLGELWKSDGSSEGTAIVSPMQIGLYWEQFIGINGILYFMENNHLWRSDGTQEGTYILKTNVYSPIVVNNYLYFYVLPFYNSSLDGKSLWRTDGSLTGTQKITESTSMGTLIVVDSFLYYTKLANQLWKSDTLFQNETMLHMLDNYLHEWSIVNTALYYVQYNTLWKSDDSTSLVFEFPTSSEIYMKTYGALNGELIFRLTDDEPYQLWKTNGTQTVKLTP